ncbi:MAG: hypothetical protein J6T84_06755 [Spirochaetaceae bacterium]|nr:hypothetical protein [Spirochaetaceae bacterium]
MSKRSSNSNSITSILVYALNNKKSGFRKEMLELFRKIEKADISDNIIFYDGMHTSLNLAGMDGAQIDIYGINNDGEKPSILIEVKANLNEDLQTSQTEAKNYCTAARKNGIPLLYIIPKGYYHKDELPNSKPKDNLIVEKRYWTEIRNIARAYDNTGLEYQIENFVQIIDDAEENCLLAKNEISLLLVPELIIKTYECINQLIKIIENYVDKNYRSLLQDNLFGIGYLYSKKRDAAKDYWIGLYPCIDSKYFLSLAISADKKKLSDFKAIEDVYYDGDYYYVPYNSENAKIIDENVSSKLKAEIEKNTELSEWLSAPVSRIKEIHTVYGLADKLCSLIRGFFAWKKKAFSERDKLCNEEGIGYYIEDNFLGLSLDIIESLKSKSNKYDEIFSLAVLTHSVNESKCETDGIFSNGFYYFFPLNAEKELFYNFLFSESVEEQQTNFNLLVDKILKNTQNYK